jgi:uroporphyrin-III C-methyltransferase
MSLLPIFLKLSQRPCLLIGAGEVALQKIPALLSADASLRVVAPKVHPRIAALARDGRLALIEREFRSEDLDETFLVVAATNDSAVNAAIFRQAAARSILFNAVDDPPNCDFYFGSVVQRDKLQIAISTAGESPALAQRLRREIDGQLPADLGPWLTDLGQLRRDVLATRPPSDDRKLLLHQLAHRELCSASECPARALNARAPSRNSHPPDLSFRPKPSRSEYEAHGSAIYPSDDPPSDGVTAAEHPSPVYLVGAGPGDPDLLTRKASSLLATADVILTDDLVPDAILALAHPAAHLESVGKRCGGKKITQAEINDRMIRESRRGRTVVRLKSGDPLVFGRAAEEMDALRAAGIPFEVVPGITAAFAAAAQLRCSLTDRRASSSIVFSSGHHACSGSAELAQPTRIVYMPGRDLSAVAEEWKSQGLAADLPVIVISRAAQPDQQITATTLADLDNTDPGPAPVLLLAGQVFAQATHLGSVPEFDLQGAVLAGL